MTDQTVKPIGPEYLRPLQPECPNCSCCTAPLCQKGRNSTLECIGNTRTEFAATVAGCPCSAETTRGTHAWRMARIRVTRHALEVPLPDTAEGILRGLADGTGTVSDPAGLITPLRALRYVAVDNGAPSITDLGHAYLTARGEPRFATPVEVQAVDVDTCTARVVVVGWNPTAGVTVLLDQLAHATGCTAEELPGKHLEAIANCRTQEADDVVLTSIRIAPPLPESWTGAESYG
ncbi:MULTISPECIES: hypothetical protein [Streptomyces]|uniref:Uncharacterized protein n=1 Tax=Streptomyces lonegramiae TaxID=3075524 RepID=A0ABU2XCE5_9ACTN|nr:hypothetical protein [Streptomyces sp. DSM 41529]MDT0543589.1 hypothetical protein [Streptomyces sp. DSM 41529]